MAKLLLTTSKYVYKCFALDKYFNEADDKMVVVWNTFQNKLVICLFWLSIRAQSDLDSSLTK